MADAKKKLVASMAEIDAKQDVEYKLIEGWNSEEELCIGSLTAGDLIVWSEANEGEAKRTAGLRLITKSLCGPAPDQNLTTDAWFEQVMKGKIIPVRYADDPKNIEIFRRKSHKVTERIVSEILDLNGMKLAGAAATAKKD